MSYKVTAWVLEYSEASLASRLVLLAMSEVAHDDGGMSFQSVATLAHKARIGESTARNCLRRLEADGRIERQGTTRHGTVIYRVKMDDAPEMQQGARIERGPELRGGHDSALGGQNRALGGQILAPNRQEPSTEPSCGESARAALKIGGRAVSPQTWQRTARALEQFNRQAGRQLLAVTGTGHPSEAAKRIYGRLASWPDLDDSAIADVIARTLASHWWGADPPGIGVVFGPKVFEENLSRSPTREPRFSTGNVHQLRPMSNADVVDQRITELRAQSSNLPQ